MEQNYIITDGVRYLKKEKSTGNLVITTKINDAERFTEDKAINMMKNNLPSRFRSTDWKIKRVENNIVGDSNMIDLSTYIKPTHLGITDKFMEQINIIKSLEQIDMEQFIVQLRQYQDKIIKERQMAYDEWEDVKHFIKVNKTPACKWSKLQTPIHELLNRREQLKTECRYVEAILSVVDGGQLGCINKKLNEAAIKDYKPRTSFWFVLENMIS